MIYRALKVVYLHMNGCIGRALEQQKYVYLCLVVFDVLVQDETRGFGYVSIPGFMLFRIHPLHGFTLNGTRTRTNITCLLHAKVCGASAVEGTKKSELVQ